VDRLQGVNSLFRCWAHLSLIALLLEESEDLFDLVPRYDTPCLVFVLLNLLLQVHVEEAQLVDLRLLSHLLGCVVQLHDQFEEIVQQVAIVLHHSLLVDHFAISFLDLIDGGGRGSGLIAEEDAVEFGHFDGAS